MKRCQIFSAALLLLGAPIEYLGAMESGGDDSVMIGKPTDSARMLNLSLRQQYFDAIKSGFKTVEGRLNSPQFKNLKPGMNISFTSVNTSETIVYRVEAMNVYANFTDMLQGEGVDKMLPGITSIDEGVALYESFPGYRDDVKKIGALAIRIKKYSDVNT